MGGCVSAAVRGREAMAPPPPAACSAARGPPGRAHCSRPVSTRLVRRPEPFRGSAPAPPSPHSNRGLEGGSGAVGELTPGLARGARRSATRGRGGAPRADNPPSFLWDLAPGWAPGPLTAPHSWRAAACPGISVAASASRGLTLEAALGEGAAPSVLLAASRFDPGVNLPKYQVPSLPVGSPAPVLVVRIISLLQKSPSYSQRYCCW